MAKKEFILDDGLAFTIYKRKGSRNLRLSIAATGKIRVTIPAWAPYKAGIEFVRSRQDWIKSQQRPINVLMDGQPIGKAHHLALIPITTIAKTTTRISESTITVKYPSELTPEHAEVQKAAQEASVRALRSQAEKLLPQRLAYLASKYGFTYSEVSVKRLKGRWGSCDHKTNIVLNLYLMQLPWDLVDYVLVHELTHTKVLRHGPDFWKEMEKHSPDARKLKKRISEYHPVLNGSA